MCDQPGPCYVKVLGDKTGPLRPILVFGSSNYSQPHGKLVALRKVISYPCFLSLRLTFTQTRLQHLQIGSLSPRPFQSWYKTDVWLRLQANHTCVVHFQWSLTAEISKDWLLTCIILMGAYRRTNSSTRICVQQCCSSNKGTTCFLLTLSQDTTTLIYLGHTNNFWGFAGKR